MIDFNDCQEDDMISVMMILLLLGTEDPSAVSSPTTAVITTGYEVGDEAITTTRYIRSSDLVFDELLVMDRSDGDLVSRNLFTPDGINRHLLVDQSSCFWITLTYGYDVSTRSIPEWYEAARTERTAGDSVSVDLLTSQGFRWEAEIPYSGRTTDLPEQIVERLRAEARLEEIKEQIPRTLPNAYPAAFAVFSDTSSGSLNHLAILRLVQAVSGESDAEEKITVREIRSRKSRHLSGSQKSALETLCLGPDISAATELTQQPY